jgi:hypothetical protein
MLRRATLSAHFDNQASPEGATMNKIGAFILIALAILFTFPALAFAQDAAMTCEGPLCGFVAAYGAYFGVAAAAILLFDRLAKLTPTKSDDAILNWLYKIFAILGFKIKDNPGTGGK